MPFLFRRSSSLTAARSRPVLDFTFRLSLNSNPGHLTEIFIEGLRRGSPPPSLPCFELDRTTTERDAVPRSSLRYLSPKLYCSLFDYHARSRSREFFDPFYRVCSVRIIYSLNYISILSLLVFSTFIRYTTE